MKNGCLIQISKETLVKLKEMKEETRSYNYSETIDELIDFWRCMP